MDNLDKNSTMPWLISFPREVCAKRNEFYLKQLPEPFDIRCPTCLRYLKLMPRVSNSYFLHWNFDWKSCFVVFFLEWNEWKNPQFNFLSQNLSIERNFFKWDGKETKILRLLFHRIWKMIIMSGMHFSKKLFFSKHDGVSIITDFFWK